jgi:alkylhydroperoxidase family enzyme
MRYDGLQRRLVEAVLGAPGDTPEALRRAVLERSGGTRDGVPEGLRTYVDKVAHHAYKVTDEDVKALNAAGQSDDSIFEITVAAAVGAAMHRLARGMAALRGEEAD